MRGCPMTGSTAAPVPNRATQRHSSIGARSGGQLGAADQLRRSVTPWALKKKPPDVDQGRSAPTPTCRSPASPCSW